MKSSHSDTTLWCFSLQSPGPVEEDFYTYQAIVVPFEFISTTYHHLFQRIQIIEITVS